MRQLDRAGAVLIDVREGDVYVAPAANKMRRVLGVLHGKVVYSRGGWHQRICNLKSFRVWCRKQQAQLTHRQLGENKK